MEDMLILGAVLFIVGIALYLVGTVSREAGRSLGFTMTTMMVGLLGFLCALQTETEEGTMLLLACVMVTFMSLARAVGNISR